MLKNKSKSRSKPRSKSAKSTVAKPNSARSNSAGSRETNAKPSHSKRTKVERKVNQTKVKPADTKPNRSPLSHADKERRQPTANTKPVVAVDLPSKAYFVEVDEEHAGQRLDNFLITHLKGVPKTRIYRIIRKGEVRINKGRVKQTTRIEQGDMIRIPPIRQSDDDTKNLDGSRYAFLNKAILFEDDALLILNKPSGMAVHAGSGIKVGVIEALRALRTDLKYLELVHRLDRETSGCLILAKKSSALRALNEDFKQSSSKNSRLDKRYLTLVKDQWQHGPRRVTKALNTNAKRHGERFVVVDQNGSYASSMMRPIAVSELASLLEVKLLTGRTHQVRVHVLSENHPVAGDKKYGDDAFNKVMKGKGLSRLFLHAARLTLVHPISQQTLEVKAPLPSELVSVLNTLCLDISTLDEKASNMPISE